MIRLLLLTDVRFGGWMAFARNLVMRCREDRIDAIAVRPGRKRQIAPWLRAEPLMDIVTKRRPTIIVAAHMKRYGRVTLDLVRRGAPIVIHDPTEYDSQLLTALAHGKNPVTVMRTANKRNLALRGIRARRLPMPYERQWDEEDEWRPRPTLAVSIARLDWDKHQEIIVDANAAARRWTHRENCEVVKLYGAENRMYTHHKLDSISPEWRRDYYGCFAEERNPVKDARLLVDMSRIKGDGGGSQYTFLEAQDAGAVPVLSQDWFTTDGDPTGPEHAYRAGCAATLGKILIEPPNEEELKKRRRRGYELLEQHTAPGLGAKYAEVARDV